MLDPVLLRCPGGVSVLPAAYRDKLSALAQPEGRSLRAPGKTCPNQSYSYLFDLGPGSHFSIHSQPLEQKSCHFSISAEECRMRNGIFLIPATPDLLRNGKITVKNGLFNMIYIVHNLHFRLA